jgi:hypothetical protein
MNRKPGKKSRPSKDGEQTAATDAVPDRANKIAPGEACQDAETPKPTEAGKEAGKEDKKEAEKSWFEKYWLPALIPLFVAVAGGLTLAYFKGELGRKPQGPPPLPPMRAAFEKPTIDTNVSLRDHLTQQRQSTTDYSEAQLAQVGYIVHFKVQIDGFKGRTCKMYWEMFDAATRARIYPAGWSREQDPVDLKPERDSDSAAAEFWMPSAAANQPFIVRLRLFDDKRVELDYEDSDVIQPAAPSPVATSQAGAKPPRK